MAYKRTNISFFELANSAYAASTVTFFEVDATTNLRLSTKITLYADQSSAVTLSNPITLDSDGKFSVPAYALDRFIAVIDSAGFQQETGVWEPSLSNSDVTTAAGYAASAAVSALAAASSASSASTSQTVASAAAASAIAAVGTVLVTSTDALAQNLNSKLTVSAPLTKTVNTPAGTATLDVGVTFASQAQVLAKASAVVLLNPQSLSYLDGDSATSGLVRFATLAEATTGTVSSAAVTPAGMAAATANTVTAVNANGGNFTNVSSGATVQSVVFNRYRMTGTTACTVKLPTTAGWVEVEFACTTAATLTVGRNGNTIDGSAADDTSDRFGDIIRYNATTVGAFRSMQIGVLPVT